MSLLREIQDACVDSSVNIADALRRAKVLASRLQARELAGWVHLELAGYDGGLQLPSYRMLRGQALGTFLGPGGARLENAAIPRSLMPEEFKIWTTEIQLRHRIAELSDMASDDAESWRIPWPADLIRYCQQHVPMYEYMDLASAYLPLTRAAVRGVLDAIRTRLLDFVLALEAEDPSAGETTFGASSPISPERANQIFHVTVNQGQAIIGNQRQATISRGQIVLSSAIPLSKHDDIRRLLTELRNLEGSASAVESATESLVRVETELANEAPSKSVLFENLDRYATLVGAAASTVDLLKSILQVVLQ